MPKFPAGQIYFTAGINSRVAEDKAFAKFVTDSIKRHLSGDWGNLCPEDWQENDFSLNKRLRLLSAYEAEGLPKIWVITEADRSATTVLFPNEY